MPQNPVAAVAQQSDGIHVVDAWKPTNPPTTNGSDNRAAENLLKVAQQFEVATNSRYAPNKLGKNETYCNIYLWDVTKALACEVPHWVDADGNSVGVGKGRELNANAVCDWLAGEGVKDQGWERVDAAEAAKRACEGKPTIVVWKNPGGIGHVAVVLPRSTAAELRIAQAGASCFFDKPIASGFGAGKALEFYSHA